ncbi:MAG: hypothetical protein GVY29_01215 [Spirochaetes bacterium]|jgi:hypothetical protein|nr:hypothetical protein [Spirochaetota bacterium]
MIATRSSFVFFGLIVFALILGVSGPLFAAGQQEDPIEEARGLVIEGRLNEAILVLQEAVRQDPELIDEAEALLDRIRRIRGDYNDLFEQLIDNLINNPDDIETTLQIIDQMEQMDEFPNERVQEQITDARVIAQLAFDRNVAATIMEEARTLIEQQQYAQAVDRYLSGFDLQRPRFEEQDYPQSIVDSANQAIEQIRGAAQSYLDTRQVFLSRERELVSAVSAQEPEAVQTTAAPYSESFVALDDVRSELQQATELLRELRVRIAELNPEDPVDWHLRLITEFTRGLQTEAQEGIIGILNRFLSGSRNRVAESFASEEEAMWARARTAVEEERYDDAQSGFTALEQIAESDQRILTLATPIEAPTEAPLPEMLGEVPSAFRGRMVSARLTDTASARLAESAVLSARDESIPAALPQELAALEERRTLHSEIVAALREQLAAWNTFRSEQITAVAEQLSEPVSARAEFTATRLEQRESRFVSREIETMDAIGGIRLSGLQERYEQLDGLRDIAVRLMEGVPYSSQEVAVQALTGEGEAPEPAEGAEGEGADVQVSYRYPDAGLIRLQDAQSQADSLLADLQSFISEFNDEPAYIRQSQAVQGHLNEARDLLSTLESTRNQIADRIIEAENQIAESQDLREEGDELIAEARQAVTQEEIEEARSIVEEARDAFFQALELQQDVAFRQESDALIQQLGDEILEAENQIVVRRTRQLVQEAEQQYDAEQYQTAFDTLENAQETWARTHPNEQNPEVQALLRYVNAALNLEGSRELAETEPLYPVLSNYLYVAREDFVEAQELLDEGQPSAAERRLVRADENLTNVTAVRPLNWEARVLKLRILQLQNAENFDEIFERRYEDALDQRDENPQEALTSLETLAALNPDYPGLQQAIIDLEIDLGIRPDPVTQAQIAESNQLLQEAQGIVQGGAGQAQTQAAISLLEEAVTLNPDNDQAKILLDELRIGLGGRATVALSSEDEQLFRRAEQLFVQNSVAQAYAIVQRLLQEENNQLYAPLLELERRITARLGI